MRVIGVDGVRGRWLAAVLDLDPTGAHAPLATWLLGSAEDVLGGAPDAPGGAPHAPGGAGATGGSRATTVGIDVPLGLVRSGLRSADAETRALLAPGPTSSVFTTAPQPAFAVARRLGGTRESRPEADAASRAAGAGGVSTQAWGIADKVLEVEDVVRALGAEGDRIVEVHPETSFAVMARHFRLPPPAGKRTAAGVAQRVGLLARTLPTVDVIEALTRVPFGRGAAALVPVDDALDALAAACSALRHSHGQAQVLGAGTSAVWSDGSPAPGRAVVVV